MRHRIRTPAVPLALLLAAGLLACSGTVTIPQGTRLVATTTARLHPDSVSVGDSLTLELAGDLEGQDGVLLEKGTPIHGAVTAVQPVQGQWPAVVQVDFGALEAGGTRHPLSSRVVSVTAEARSREDGSPVDVRGGLVGTTVRGRSAAAMVQSQVRAEPGTSVVLGTGRVEGFVPAGARVELEVTAPLEVPPPGG